MSWPFSRAIWRSRFSTGWKKSKNLNIQPILLKLVPLRPKGKKKDFSIWAQQPDLPAGETLETLKAFAEENRNEVRRNPRKHKAHKDFMDKTFPLRRHEIITAPKLVKAVLMEYPSLKYFIHVSISCKLLVSVRNVNQLQVCLFVFWPTFGWY